MYRIGSFVVKHYQDICQYDLQQFVNMSKCSQEEVSGLFFIILDFIPMMSSSTIND